MTSPVLPPAGMSEIYVRGDRRSRIFTFVEAFSPQCRRELQLEAHRGPIRKPSFSHHLFPLSLVSP